jgi:succinoglycan biosynthesis protein ExoA
VGDEAKGAVQGVRVSAPRSTLPTVDVVVPAYNEARHIVSCIEGILAQDYPADLLRVIIVDAGSEDATAELAAGMATEDERLLVVTGRGRLTTPEALNVGIEVSGADVFARVDAHGRPASNYVSRAVDALLAGGEGIAGVGGQPSFSGESAFGRAFTAARSSKLGVGGSVYAASGTREIVDTVPWGIYWRVALERVGGFDPRMNHGEDEELNWRLKHQGMGVMLDGAIRFEYVPRSSLRGAFDQYRDYGRARVRVVSAHPDFLRARHLAPALLVLALTFLVAAGSVSRLARVALVLLAGTYVLAAGIGGIAFGRAGGPKFKLDTALCFPALHFGYGIGTLEGIARAVVERNGIDRSGPLSFPGR